MSLDVVLGSLDDFSSSGLSFSLSGGSGLGSFSFQGGSSLGLLLEVFRNDSLTLFLDVHL